MMAVRKDIPPLDTSAVKDPRQMFGSRLSFAASEAYKLLRTNLLFSLPKTENRCRVVGVTSALRNEGKSTTAVNLAYSVAETGNRVLLIEADMRLPTLAKRLRLRYTPGLSSLLAGLCGIKDVILPSGLIDNLHMIVSGEIPPNPSELLGSQPMVDVVQALSSAYDFIIFDLPPVTAVADALVLSKLIHGMMVVVRKDYCDQQSLAEAMRQLDFLDVKVLGFVMTYADAAGKGYKKYKKKYRYGANYGYRYGYRAHGKPVAPPTPAADLPAEPHD